MPPAEPSLAQATAAVQFQQPFALRSVSFVLPRWPGPPPLSQGSRENRFRAHRADTSVGKLRLHLSAWLPAFQAVPGGTLSTVNSTVVKTIQMTIDDQLLKLVDRMRRERKTTRSAFIRHALEAEIRHQHLRDEEARHTQGYARHPVAPGEFDVWLNEQDWGAQ